MKVDDIYEFVPISDEQYAEMQRVAKDEHGNPLRIDRSQVFVLAKKKFSPGALKDIIDVINPPTKPDPLDDPDKGERGVFVYDFLDGCLHYFKGPQGFVGKPVCFEK